MFPSVNSANEHYYQVPSLENLPVFLLVFPYLTRLKTRKNISWAPNNL